ncbi:hypothetical protein [Fimbriiglobus ruber]|uniref:Octaprenyl diphosphate synthase n=1 Tax=Fimbriiglobus ruber TaxID=1908690 RepID=A0A225D7H8_9BACT|nr:hypothetical protein [Fimbriiglobus ruber]OWK37521.1 hypothetical protein FRUB_06641 [Fimbriiglobus ruber]
MHVPAHGTRWKALHDGLSSSLIAVVSVVRGLVFYLSGRPGTPLRALCIAAFDTLQVIRNGNRLSKRELNMLAVLLDFAARANAAFDHKGVCRCGRRVTPQLLEEAEIGASVAEYLRRLGNLEGGRPQSGGDRSQFQNVRFYREAVVRLSLGMVATAASGNQCLDEAIEATFGDGDLNLLFRIAMQCQIIDDVLDYSHDRPAGLPSFLTACQSLPQALELTRCAARGYADDRHLARAADVFPLRVALFHVSLCTRLVVSLRRWRAGACLGRPPAKRDD